ncbi:MAG: hypothetical protein M1815_002626 [Lichina confinis]|nr:MAG: hypothetical protein M1815_002626 [Lichina confinis]
MWEAVGPACDAFKDICPEINKLLETRSEELDEGEDISPAFSYGIWMMGRDPAHAIPTIILGCVSRRVRTRAEAIIKQSGLLRPGIAIKKVFATPQPLTLEEPPLRPLVCREHAAASRDDLGLACSGYADSGSAYSGRVSRLNLAGPTRSWEKYGSSMAHDFAYYPLFNGFSLGLGLILQFDSDEESDESCLFEDTNKVSTLSAVTRAEAPASNPSLQILLFRRIINLQTLRESLLMKVKPCHLSGLAGSQQPLMHWAATESMQRSWSSTPSSRTMAMKSVDVLRAVPEAQISVYDGRDQVTFLGQVSLRPTYQPLSTSYSLSGWFPLQARDAMNDRVSGQLHATISFSGCNDMNVGPADFEGFNERKEDRTSNMYIVRKKDTQCLYGMKVFAKSTVFHDSTVSVGAFERNVLEEAKILSSPFVTSLAFTFQTPSYICLLQQYPTGGRMFWHLRREGKFTIPRLRSYLVEIILGLQFLRQHDIRYFDLDPDKILLDARGHIVLSYFGFPQAAFLSGGPTVSKYTAPEMLLADASDLGMADFWSLGAIALEMACGQVPIYNTDTATLRANILSQEIIARKGVLDPDGRDLIMRLLNRDVKRRLGALRDCGELMDHAFFRGVDWEQMRRRAVTPPFKPVNVSATTGATPRPSDDICGSDLKRFVSPPRSPGPYGDAHNYGRPGPEYQRSYPVTESPACPDPPYREYPGQPGPYYQDYYGRPDPEYQRSYPVDGSPACPDPPYRDYPGQPGPYYQDYYGRPSLEYPSCPSIGPPQHGVHIIPTPGGDRVASATANSTPVDDASMGTEEARLTGDRI